MSTRIPKITKKVRDEAILVLQVGASLYGSEWLISDVCDQLGVESSDLAFNAWNAVFDSPAPIGDDWSIICAEAAALLEDGWVPGDPVEAIDGE